LLQSMIDCFTSFNRVAVPFFRQEQTYNINNTYVQSAMKPMKL
jgi:hypothetical protein